MAAKKITKITVIDESDDSLNVKKEESVNTPKKISLVKKVAEKKADKKITEKKTPAKPKATGKKIVVAKNLVNPVKNSIKKAVAKKELIEIAAERSAESLIKETLKQEEGKHGLEGMIASQEKALAEEGTVAIKIKPEAAPIAAAVESDILPESPVKRAVMEEIGAVSSETKSPSAPVATTVSIDDSSDILGGGMTAVKNVINKSVKEQEDKEVEEIVKQKIFATRSVKLYRKIAYFFILLTIVLVSIVSYYSFVKVTITLIPNQERISNNMIFDVYDGSAEGKDSSNSIEGIVKLKKINHEIIFDASGADVIGKEAIGKVTIVNNYTKNQPLVATTRLLSSDGKLFRLSDTVNVPAGGSVSAKIYADEPSEEMEIGPTTFSIPGLWAGLQEQIFAKSDEKVVYQQKVKKYIVQEDLDDSIRELKQKLLAEAKNQINKDYEEYGQIIYKIDENSIESEVDKKAGEEVDTFLASMEADVIVVAFDDQKSAELAKQKFISSLLKNKELLSFDNENIIYSLNNYDHAQGIATINATFEGKVSLKEDSDIVEIDKILGLNSSQLDAYLSGLPEIAGFEVKYFPSFIKRVPKLVDRIEIKIKK
jgi:hypothetical protein